MGSARSGRSTTGVPKVLDFIRVRDLGVIKEAEVEFGPGMIALTGETGAGKTLVTSAIELLLGGRGDRDAVRGGAELLKVEGIFHLDDEVLVSREVSTSGRSKAYLNGELTTAAGLSNFLSDVIEIYGQQLAVRLVRPSFQLDLVDRFAGIDATELSEVRRQIRSLLAEISAITESESARERELDFARFELAELRDAKLLSADEDDEVDARIRLLSSAEEISDHLERAITMLAGEGGTVGDRVASAGIELEMTELGAELVPRLQSASLELIDILMDIRRLSENVESDPVELERLHGRASLLLRLKRKHNRTLPELIAYEQELSSRLDSATSTEDTLNRLGAQVEELRAREAALAGAMRTSRSNAGKAIERRVATRLSDLALDRARFEVHIGNEPDGSPVEFLFSANLGSMPGPLAKAASGGELSRLMLALCLVLGTGAGTVVFDEIDAGIGGETALRIGRALSELAKERQVIVVTHLAQVAAFADRHLQVTKESTESETVTKLLDVSSGELRVHEISRMLSGQGSSAAANVHARELLELARA